MSGCLRAGTLPRVESSPLPAPAPFDCLLPRLPHLLPPLPPADLESLFIQPEEVRRELPEATQRFAKIDAAVRAVLADMAAARNCVACCNREGLLKHLEAQQGELELCEKVRRWGVGVGTAALCTRGWGVWGRD